MSGGQEGRGCQATGSPASGAQPQPQCCPGSLGEAVGPGLGPSPSAKNSGPRLCGKPPGRGRKEQGLQPRVGRREARQEMPGALPTPSKGSGQQVSGHSPLESPRGCLQTCTGQESSHPLTGPQASGWVPLTSRPSRASADLRPRAPGGHEQGNASSRSCSAHRSWAVPPLSMPSLADRPDKSHSAGRPQSLLCWWPGTGLSARCSGRFSRP